MSNSDVSCSDCGLTLSELPSFREVSTCPNCGSHNRCITAFDITKIQTLELAKMVGKNPQRTGKQKVRRRVIAGDELHKKSGKWYRKLRIIDLDSDYYLEQITDRETGEIIHFCEEPLSKHRGHGSAKLRPGSEQV